MDSSRYREIEEVFLPLDKELITRTRNLRLVPALGDRHGGKASYGEWCHVIGIFQTLMYQQLRNKTGNTILDAGCGTGILAIASEPFLGENGKYIGIDVQSEEIEICERHYPEDWFTFQHLNVANMRYAPDQPHKNKPWNVADSHCDLVTALSLWTHLNEGDARFYLAEVDRVLKPGSKAIITTFLIDDLYEQSLARRDASDGRYHGTSQEQWIFDSVVSASGNWRSPAWADPPEKAIGITPAGIQEMLSNTSLRWSATNIGNWKEVPGIFFQDILIFHKSA